MSFHLGKSKIVVELPPSGFIGSRLYGFFSLFVVSLLASPVFAAQPEHQQNWQPNRYKVECRAGDRCLAADDQRKIEQLLEHAVDAVHAMNFRPPTVWGERVTTATGEDYIKLYDDGNPDLIAAAGARCNQDVPAYDYMKVGGRVEEFSTRDYLLFYFTAHEVFHLVQHGYVIHNEERCGRYAPGWLLESTATAVGQSAMRARYPNVVPSMRDDQEARGFAGLRRYDKPLPDRKFLNGAEVKTADHDMYRTSSFWWHVSHAYYRGNFFFLDEYMSRDAIYDDWVAWLRGNIEMGTGAHLGIVHAGFLADFSGWGDRGFDGQFFGRSKWLDEAFGGCEKLYLNKELAQGYVDVKLRPLSGDCIEVRVAALGEGGVQKGESAAIQVAGVIIDGPESARDGVHLGLAMSNDQQRFHCAREVKTKRKNGVGRCIFVPDDGVIRMQGGDLDARVWNVITQEKGDSKTMRQEPGERQGELVNVYTVSNTPITVSSKDTRYGGVDPITVRLYFVLDVATVEHGDPGTTKKRVVSRLSQAPNADPQTTLPKQDANGKPVNSYALPDFLRPNLPSVGMPSMGEIGKLSVISVTEDLWDQDGGMADRSAFQIYPLEARGDDFEPTSLSVGETGSFPALFAGSLNGEPANSIEPGTLDVLEFTDLVLRARFNGSVCRTKDMRANGQCAQPVPVSGTLVKAFAGSRLPGRFMKVEDTPGVALYREAAEYALASASSDSSDAANPSQGPGTASSAGTLNQPCACTCEEMSARDEKAEELKQQFEAGDESVFNEMMALNRCTSPCQREYLVCILDQDKAEKAAADDKRNNRESQTACDCSCEGVDTLMTNIKSMGQNITPGAIGGGQLDSITRMSQCMQTCQNEVLSCQMKR